MGERFGPKKLQSIHHNPLAVLLASVPLALGLWATVDGASSRNRFKLLAAGVVILFWVLRSRPWALRRDVEVRADAGGLRIGDLLLARDDIRHALVIPATGGEKPRVRVTLAGLRPARDLVVADLAEGRALLRAMGRDATQAAASFRVASGASGSTQRMLTAGLVVLTIVGIVAVVSMISTSFPGFVLAPLLGMIAYVLLMVVPGRLVVGADGIAHRWLFWQRFIGYGEIADVGRYSRKNEEGLLITLTSGESLRVPVDGGGRDGSMTAGIEERVKEARAGWQRGDHAEDGARLARGDRSPDAWIRALRAMGAGADAGPREAPVPRDRLFHIVEDPRADPAVRAAAAVALSGAAEDADRERLRAAAGTIAAPRLRVAIEAASGDDDQALTEALAAVEEEADQRREER